VSASRVSWGADHAKGAWQAEVQPRHLSEGSQGIANRQTRASQEEEVPPTVFPTGTTIYKPDKCWNGYTIYPTKTATGAVLIDMNGNVAKSWPQFPGYPILLLPEGHIIGGQVGRVTNTYDHELVKEPLYNRSTMPLKTSAITRRKLEGALRCPTFHTTTCRGRHRRYRG
jgi:hypothetical protein